MEKDFPYPIDIGDLQKLPQLIGGGLRGLAICAHGIARSWRHADEMTVQGIPTVFLEGGFDMLSRLKEPQRSEVIDQIANIPNRWAVLNTKEIKKYADLLRRTQVCLIRDDFS